MLHQGFRYPYREPPIRTVPAIFPHNYSYWELANLLTVQSEVKAANGGWGGAMDADLDAVQLGEELPHGTPLIGWAIGTQCQMAARRQVWPLVDHLNAIQARAAAKRLAQIGRDHVLFADVLQEQEWDDQAGLQTLMRGHDWPGNFLTETSSFLSADAVESDRWAALRIRLTGKRRIMANYTAYMDQAIANARRPYATHPVKPLLPTDPANQIMLSDYANSWAEEVDSQTQNALLRTALALCAYKQDHGAYPALLADLAPSYLQSLPGDPFALSGPLHYKQLGAKYLLYSVGPDGKDDGGRAIFDTSKPAPTVSSGHDERRWVREDSRGDIVAGVNL